MLVVSITGGTGQPIMMLRIDWEKLHQLSGYGQIMEINIIGRTTKVKIFDSNAKAILFYVSESWTITQRPSISFKILSTESYEGRILGIRWPDKITIVAVVGTNWS